ncbi:PIN domain-containing protein [Acinetobacter variabilis]|uniref:PIN domain-containing protein n=1 Tax=Acinetobacter variabilis TaxID=70346 RepID=UPI0037705882
MDSNKELKSRLVFIDTCAFIGKNFNFGIDSLGRLQTYIEEGKIHLLLPDITRSEIEKHIKLKSEEAHSKIKKLFSKDPDVKILRVATDLPLSGALEIPTAEAINENIKSRFQEFIDYPNVEEVSTQTVNSKVIFDNYFNNRPPFDNPKKKVEFPDAFVLEAINNISITRANDLYVVSSDNDLKSYTDLNQNLIHLQDINNLNDLIIHNDKELAEPAKFADAVFESLKKQILEQAREKLKNAEYEDSELSEYIYDDIIHDIEIKSISIIEKNIQDVSSTQAQFQINFEVELTAFLVIPDLARSPYDLESGSYIKLEYVKSHKAYKKTYSAHIWLEYEDGIKSNAEIYDFSFDDAYFELS